MIRPNTWLLSLVLILTLISGACAGAANGPKITIIEAWGRPAPNSAMIGAFYLIIRNKGAADRLVSAESEACGSVEIHETSLSSDGLMSMRPLGDGLEIPAGEEVVLGPGGLHVMCIEKKADFTTGNKINLTLNFKTSGSTTVEVEIREP